MQYITLLLLYVFANQLLAHSIQTHKNYPDNWGDECGCTIPSQKRFQPSKLEKVSLEISKLWSRNPTESETPHSLRMQKWKIYIKRGWTSKLEVMYLNFLRDGKVITQDGRLGVWWMSPFGILWDLPLNSHTSKNDIDNVLLHFSAEVHWNIFGANPKMMNGIVTRDRTSKSFLPYNWLRPVIGSFYGEGYGKDTLDTTYKNRG